MRYSDDSYAYVMLREHNRAMRRQRKPKPFAVVSRAYSEGGYISRVWAAAWSNQHPTLTFVAGPCR
jgi:hypothetical protein